MRPSGCGWLTLDSVPVAWRPACSVADAALLTADACTRRRRGNASLCFDGPPLFGVVGALPGPSCFSRRRAVSRPHVASSLQPGVRAPGVAAVRTGARTRGKKHGASFVRAPESCTKNAATPVRLGRVSRTWRRKTNGSDGGRGPVRGGEPGRSFLVSASRRSPNFLPPRDFSGRVMSMYNAERGRKERLKGCPLGRGIVRGSRPTSL